ncbi:MAG TPA: TonB-dependent receptor [Bryobacteraceae bacterium]|nr:TonB-dependent receptor [Bryobacteraceae bacterium]
MASAALFCTALALNAQSPFGTIAGLVKNPAKAAIAGATVTATKTDGSTIRTTISGSDGIYSFSDVSPGEYSVVAQADGYPDLTLASLAVNAGKATRADLIMPVAPAVISSAQPAAAPAAAPAAPAPAPKPAVAGFSPSARRMNWRELFTQKPGNSGDAPVTTDDSATTASLDKPPASAFDKPFDVAKAEVPDFPNPAPQPQAPAAAAAPAPAAPPPVDNQTPFAFADFTWMNAVPRNHDSVLDGKYFSPEIRADVNYIYDYQHPIDHTLGGTTEGERTGEVVLQQLNVGGDFHWDRMQMRLLTQFGATSTAVPRNDASNTGANGQWDLADAYRYLTEGYAGYHMDVQHGLNIQAGIFMSYIGLFSFYSFDNWNYQPSYVSSNTPWFFTGMRVQWFPTNKLKFEPWLINGWQSYGKFNGRPGVGGQILWRPTGNLDFVWNTYTLGQDTLGTHRTRLHEDDSMEWKYWENPNKLMHRMAFSLTFDIGCETGGGTYVNSINPPAPKVQCFDNSKTAPAQNFIGAMIYQRFWFGHDHYGVTLGGGFMANPGRYLVLLPPINGATATTGTPYFTENPGQKFSAYDYQIAFQWMPTQFVTWNAEFTQRGANVPYFTGPGGITPPGGNNGMPGSFVCNDGSVLGTNNCIGNGGIWQPDLRKQERRLIFALMVHL